jgi:hypothetical protein
MLLPLLVTLLLSSSPVTKPEPKITPEVCATTAWYSYMICLDKLGVSENVRCTKFVLKQYAKCELEEAGK